MTKIITAAMEAKALNEIVERQLRTPLKTVSVEDDQQFRDLVAHCLRPGEKLGEFAARTGLGKATIVAQNMTPDQIEEL